MNRCVSIFVILALIAAGSACVLFAYHDDVRSDVTELTPYITIDNSAEGNMTIGDERYPFVIAHATFGVDLIKDEKSHCWASLSFSRSNFGPFNDFYFEFWSMDGIQAPEGSILMMKSGNEAKYAYDDPLTDTKLTFHLLNDMVDSISFKGTTMNEFDGKLEYVAFDIKASFENNAVYVNNIIKGSLPDAKTLYISGEENGRSMSGTLNIVPLSCNVWNGGREKVVACVTIDIQETSIPDSMLSDIVLLGDDYAFEDQILMQYLDHEGNYVDQCVKYTLSKDNEQKPVLEGSITTSVISPECEVIEQNKLEFSYEVVR